MTYAHLPDALIDAWPKLSPSAKAVAVALASFMNGKGECWPSVAALIERTGLHKRQTVADAVAELVGAGLVVIRWRARRARVLSWAKVPLNGTIESAGERHNGDSESAGERTPKVPLNGTGNNTKNTTTKKPDVWRLWIGVHRDAGRDDPIADGPDLGASKRIGKLATGAKISETELRSILALYLADAGQFLVENGHALRFLSGGKITAYRAHVKELDPPAMDPAEIERIEADAAKVERVKE